MRVLLSAHHQYPADGAAGSGLQPKAFPSGSANYLHDLLAQGLAELGHDVAYLLPNGACAPLPPGVTHVGAPPRPEDVDADVYHSLLYTQSAEDPLGRTLRSRGCAWVSTCHLDRQSRGLERQRLGPHTIYVSPSLARTHESHRFVWNGLDPSRYCYSERKQDYLLFVSALDWAYDKGLEMALAVARRTGLRLVVAGTGRTQAIIDEVTRACHAAGAECVGDARGATRADLYAGAAAVLHPTRLNEGCPLVIIEALLSGTPVVTSGAGGCPDMVPPEVGFICATESDYAAAVARAGEISPAACRRHAMENYHYLRMAADYVREYQAELDRVRGLCTSRTSTASSATSTSSCASRNGAAGACWTSAATSGTCSAIRAAPSKSRATGASRRAGTR
jgi:glycosyltransferase involved in cell wall biosynthesis